MLFTSSTQFIVLALVLIIGWLFGLASHPGGKKWKQQLHDEQAARASDIATRDARIKELEASNAALSAERDRLSTAVPATATTAAAATATAPDPAPAKRGWFDRFRGDDLTRLRGVDDELATRLHEQGVRSFAELAALSDQDELALERRIDLPAGYFPRERLREQAQMLADGRTDEHARAFG